MDNIRNFCKDILKIDPKIRYVGILYHGEITSEVRERLTPLLNDHDSQRTVREAVIRWHTRISIGKQLGGCKFALAKYGLVYRITVPLTRDDLILVSTDVDCNVLDLATTIQKMTEELDLDSFDYQTKLSKDNKS